MKILLNILTLLQISFMKSYKYFKHLTNQSTNVLVHCMAGISRSATIILAYLMKYRNMKYSDAYLFVNNKRNVIYPNQGFRK